MEHKFAPSSIFSMRSKSTKIFSACTLTLNSTKHSSKRLRSLFAHVEEARPQVQRRLDGLLDRDWQFAIALALAVGVLVWFGRSIKDFFSPAVAGVMVPALIGQ